MTFASLFADLQILSVFLIAGYLLREFVPLFRKIFLPSSVIAGVVALVGGPQVLGLWKIPASFSSFSGQLIVLIMCFLVWGVRIDKSRIANYMDYLCFSQSMYYMQIGFGALTGILLRKVWTELPLGWGTMAVSAYCGGHGTVAAYAGVFESLGYGTDYAGLGMIMATLGLISAIIVGMVFVNYGVRKGWAKYVDKDSVQGDLDERGLLPKGQQTPIGTQRVYPSSINALAFQFAMGMALIWFGRTLLALLGKYVWAGFGTLPNMLYGIVGAIIVWPLMCKFGLQDYVDKRTCSNISGFCLELLITGSIATMNLSLFSDFFAPIMIQFIIILVLTALMCFWYNRRIAENEWFEKALFVFGQGMGATPTGLALVRAVDPDSVACPGEAHGVASGFTSLYSFWIPATLPVLATTLPLGEVGFGLVACAVFMTVGWVLFRKKVKALGR